MSVTLDLGSLFPKPVKPEWQLLLEDSLAAHEATRDWVERTYWLAGSTAINGEGADIDVVVEHNYLDDAARVLDEAGWETVQAEVYRGIASDGWFSARKGDFNLLVAISEVAELWNLSTEVCKLFVSIVGRPSTRDERVAFHKVIFND